MEGVMWGSVVKAPERTAASGPFSEELEERLSPEEMEKAKKLLAELAGKGEDLVRLVITVTSLTPNYRDEF